MKSTTTYFLLFFCALSFALSSCSKEEGCTDESALNFDSDAEKDDGSCEYQTETTGQLAFHLHPKMGDESFSLTTEYTDGFGTKYSFSRAQFYAYTPAAVHVGMNMSIDDEYMIVDGTTVGMYSAGTMEAGHYDALFIGVGVEQALNHEDPATYDASNALAPQSPSMHWSWTSGYKFIVLEGTYDSDDDGTLDANFVYHIGNDDMLRTTTLDEHFEVEAGETMEFHMDVDFGQFLAGVDIKSTPNTHTNDNPEVAEKIADNSTTVFVME